MADVHSGNVEVVITFQFAGTPGAANCHGQASRRSRVRKAGSIAPRRRSDTLVCRRCRMPSKPVAPMFPADSLIGARPGANALHAGCIEKAQLNQRPDFDSRTTPGYPLTTPSRRPASVRSRPCSTPTTRRARPFISGSIPRRSCGRPIAATAMSTGWSATAIGGRVLPRRRG